MRGALPRQNSAHIRRRSYDAEIFKVYRKKDGALLICGDLGFKFLGNGDEKNKFPVFEKLQAVFCLKYLLPNPSLKVIISAVIQNKQQ